MPRLRVVALLLLAALALNAGALRAQSPVNVVMLSDIHFDPFHDPARVAALRTEPIDRWPAILSAPPSATLDADLQALQSECHSRALDTAWPLLKSTLQAAHDAQPRPAFITLSGDLLAHEFPCRFHRLAPGATPQELAAFSAKTVAFVVAQLRQAFPRTPVYGALGNNDSGCTDYRETPKDAFLTSASDTLTAAAGLQPAPALFTPEGDFSVALPAPMDHARLIVLQNIFEARQFTTCGGNPDRTAERAQIDWLRAQLAAARAHNEHVWVMAHIPPGVDVYTSFRRYVFQPAALCNAEPQGFLANTALADALLDYADIVRLALFGHTHMDEFRLLHRSSAAADPQSANANGTGPSASSPAVTSSAANSPAASLPAANSRAASLPAGNSSARNAQQSVISTGAKRSGETPVSKGARAEGTSQSREAISHSTEPTVPAKLVPSVTPYAGNHPAFLVAQVDPRTAILKDWRTIVSPGPEGSTPPWAEAYRFTTAFHVPDFSAQSALKLADSFTADKTGQSAQSSAFREHFYPGDIGLYALGLAQIWPAYACSIREDHPSAVHSCICAAQPPPKADQ